MSSVLQLTLCCQVRYVLLGHYCCWLFMLLQIKHTHGSLMIWQ